MSFVCLNGQMLPAAQPLFTAGNRSFKYGDGVFETIKVYDNKICLSDYHFERLFSSLQLLKIDIGAFITSSVLTNHISELCRLNNCLLSGRVRLAVYRNDENGAEYVIEAWPLSPAAHQWNNKGYTIDIYPDGRKSRDAFANLKTANYLLYVLAGQYAQEKNIDECLVLNSDNYIADASKANVFIIHKENIMTPALHQGCINGVMRRHIIQVLKENNYTIHQAELTEAMLCEADEMFLTNAIYGIRWVQSFRQKQYCFTSTKHIYQHAFERVFI